MPRIARAHAAHARVRMPACRMPTVWRGVGPPCHAHGLARCVWARRRQVLVKNEYAGINFIDTCARLPLTRWQAA